MKLHNIILAGIVPLIAGASIALAGPGDAGNGHFGHMMWGGGPGWWGPAAMILFWGGIIAVAVVAIRALAPGRGQASSNAMDVLKERYARGEIDEAEFRRRKQELQS